MSEEQSKQRQRKKKERKKKRKKEICNVLNYVKRGSRCGFWLEWDAW